MTDLTHVRTDGAWQLPPVAPAALPRVLPAPGMPASPASEVRLRAGALTVEVRRAGLIGRGGAGFPTATKMAAVAGARRSVVVANGTEGEPASDKDKVLLEANPHLVLDGATLAAEAVGAGEVVVCVERSATAALASLRHALAERRRAGVDRVGIRLEATPARYVAGEESALVHWLNGGDARPTFVPPRPFQRGVGGVPTLVDNVETLANVALIARFGAEWYRQVGTEESPGSALATVSGHVSRPGVYELPLGIALEDAIAAAGGSVRTAGAVLVGGYFGTWLPPGVAAGLTWDPSSLRAARSALGCGVIFALPGGACGLSEAARVTRWMASQSAGQCGPCTNGLPAIARALDAVEDGERSGRAEAQLLRWLSQVERRGACRHPDGTARFVRSALCTFAGEVEEHRRRGPCPPSLPLLPVPAFVGGWR